MIRGESEGTMARATVRQDELARMGDWVLSHGLGAATLRPLARAAGTSDRMLIYRYGTKDRLIAQLLGHLADRLTALLDAAPLPPTASAVALADALLQLLRGPAAWPFIRVWFEVVAGAAAAEGAHRDTAARILTHFQGWLVPRLPPGAADPQGEAAALLRLIQGALVFEAAGAAAASAPTPGQG
jgi:AcrR family transcriptional regulator